MEAIVDPARPLCGTLRVPSDKAIGHRVAFVAALAKGRTRVDRWPSAEDCRATLELIEELGVFVRTKAGTLWIEGRGSSGLRAPHRAIFCGESGTTLRLAAGLLAGQPFTTKLKAAPSLSRRPMRRIVDPLARMGARIEGSRLAARGGLKEIYPPLTIYGQSPLRAIRYAMPVASAQVKSAILLAGLSAEGRTTVVERYPTRDHTERLLGAYGLSLRRRGPSVSLTGGTPIAPGPLAIPGDISGAAFLIVAALCVPGSRLTLLNVGLNPTRTGFLRVLRRMGASIRVTLAGRRWEPHGEIMVEASALRGTRLEEREAPGVIDELPILMTAAACARGKSRFAGIGELRVKETDRIRSMVSGLRHLGARVRLTAEEAVEIEGGSFRGGTADSAGDHRTAMSLAVAALAARQRSFVRGVECVSKSFPEFFDCLREVGGPATVKTVDKAESLC